MTGILDLQLWQVLLAVFAMMHITLLAVTVYLHRFSAHKALELNPVLQHFFRFWLWLTTGMTTKAWTAIHRKHHAKCETEEDPHSPVVLGLKTVLFKGVALYRRSNTDEVLQQYGKGTPDDFIEKNLYTRFSKLGLLLMLIIDIVLFGAASVWVWIIQMLTVPLLAAGVINGLGHSIGYRNFSCPDASTNILPIGFIILGEELHNNHHAHPTSAKFSMKWWEIDTGWAWIQLFRLLGLAKVNKKNIPARKTGQSLQLGRNRFEALFEYTQKVLLPMCRIEKKATRKQDRGLYKNARKMLTMPTCKLDASKQAQLNDILNYSPVLKILYDMRCELTRIFSIPGDFKEPLLQWCKRAELSGLAVLREYAVNLKRS